ncbi:hypothetical protein, partial [Brachyspira aalborgi]|uniref:hypothetical protein n=1 Tax=Brachyspira aalborgi TaxID=29522 RepID=UPI001A7EBF3E
MKFIFKNIIITIVKANKKYYKLYKTLDLFLIYCIILTMLKKNEILKIINSAAAQLSSAQLSSAQLSSAQLSS